MDGSLEEFDLFCDDKDLGYLRGFKTYLELQFFALKENILRAKVNYPGIEKTSHPQYLVFLGMFENCYKLENRITWLTVEISGREEERETNYNNLKREVCDDEI